MRRPRSSNSNKRHKETILEPEAIVIPPAEEKVLTPSELYKQTQEARAIAADPVKAKAADDAAKAAAAAAAEPQKRASGDERKFRRALSKRDQEIGELRARLDALAPKPVAATVATPGAALKREDYASDELFAAAKTEQIAQKLIDKKTAEDAQAAEVKATIDGYNERMAAAPAKYEDWDEVLKAGTGAALSVDLGKECPSLFWAIARSPHNDDCFYHWLKEPAKLQGLIDLYKSGPKGEIEALVAFHRFEGKVARDSKPATVEGKTAAEEKKKADDAAKPPKPRPSAEASVRGGTATPGGKPEIYLAGTHTINPAYKVWRRAQAGRN